jgi:molecular chaperone GrpE (heat shock protein)
VAYEHLQAIEEQLDDMRNTQKRADAKMEKLGRRVLGDEG